MKDLSDHAQTMSDARHFSMEMAAQLGPKVEALEEDDELQDALLSVHHSCILTLSSTTAAKIIQNSIGNAFIQKVVQQPK